ncbi:MAG: zinc dependent phospholipase C family protein, partial [Methylocystaceae bacterium]
THVMCNQQARIILANDGLEIQHKVLELYRAHLDAGVVWPDRGIKSFHHFYNPLTGCGLPGGKPVYNTFINHLNCARRFWFRGNYAQSMFYLGAATHFLQDLCEPHHSNCQLLQRHNHYEHWVENNLSKFTVNTEGTYRSWSPDQWLEQSAYFSKEWLPAVAGNGNLFSEATGKLLPFTQRITAGFWDFFMRSVNITESPALIKKAV